jgi:hypothetical protein
MNQLHPTNFAATGSRLEISIPSPLRRVLFFHCSDLYSRTGTAVLYRRLLPLVEPWCRIWHLFGSNNSELDDKTVREQYSHDLPGVSPVRLPFHPLFHLYRKVSRRFGFLHPHIPPAILYSHWVAARIRQLRPDLLWFSSDDLPFTQRILARLIPHLGTLPLHVSIYDPLEFWQPPEADRGFYDAVLARADSLDAIGENMRTRLLAEAPGKPVHILSDYASSPPDVRRGAPAAEGEICGVITGALYGVPELQDLLNRLAALGRPVRLRWYGNDHDRRFVQQVSWPHQIVLATCPPIPRERIATEIADAHFGYMNFPDDRPHFARYSVPTKLVTYAEAGLPVLFHAPADSEVATLNARFFFGLNLGAKPPTLDALTTFFKTPEPHAAGIRQLASERFDKGCIANTLRKILLPECV